MTLLSWIGKRELKRSDERMKTMEKVLASNSATIAAIKEASMCKDDLDELRTSVTASINLGVQLLRDDVERRHVENREDIKELRQELRVRRRS